MSDSLEKNKIKTLLQRILQLNTFSVSIALAVYSYQGFFSRYISDDYCHGGLINEYSFLGAIQRHYLTFSNRYMILVIPYLTGVFGSHKLSYLPALLIILWVIALAWLLREVGIALSANWKYLILFLFAGLASFFAILQAPNRYQSVFWEVGSVVHFAPLIWTTFLAASVLTVIRKRNTEKKFFRWGILFFVITFFIGGFSEMNGALIFILALLSFISLILWMKKGHKHDLSLWITGSILLSSLVSISVMAVAPGNVLRIGEVPTIFVFIQRILTYPIDFIVDSIKTFPLPSALTVLVPFLIVFLLNDADRQNYFVVTRKKLLISFLAAPLILYILLMTNFSPSAYALAYPADRALLEARYLMTLFLIFEGTLLGLYFSQMRSPFIRSMYTKYFALVLLTVFSFYPLRSALQTADTFDFYQQRAAAWDLRDAKIRAAQKNGEMDIIVQEFDSLHGIKELDTDPTHWVNRCAARYYEVDSISAYPLNSE